jgi:VanZ family protein
MIWFLDDKQETIQYLTVQALTGDFAHYRAERIVSIPDAARYFVTTLINRDSDGAFELTDARVTVVSTSLLYRVISPLIFALWVGLLLAAMLWLLKNGGPQVGFPASVLLLLILTGVLLPESITTNHVLPAYQKVAALLSLQHAEPLGILYKVGHFLFFLALSFTLMLNRYRLRLSAPMVLTFMLVFALATEGLQLHLFNRSTRFLDIAIDLAGVLLAWLIVSKLQSLLVRKKRIRTSTIATKSRRYR